MKYYQRKRMKDENYLRWYHNNIKPVPKGFNQIDSPYKLGNTQLSKHLTPNEDGEYDWAKEEIAIKSEKKRVMCTSKA